MNITTFKRHGRAALCLALLCFALFAGAARADNIRVFAVDAFEAPLTDLAQSFRTRSGHVVTLTFASGEEIQKRLAGGEAADAVIVSKTVLDALQEANLTVRGARIDIAQAPPGAHHGDTPATFIGGIVMHTPVAPAAVAFIRYVASPEGLHRLSAAGFAVPQATPR